MAMPKHRRGVLTLHGAATLLFPKGFACASLGGLAERLLGQERALWATRLGGTGRAPREAWSAALALLDVAHGYAFEAPPCI